MKLGLTYTDFCLHCGGASLELSNKKTPLVNRVCYDSRKITEVKNTAFFALKGSFRDGHHFIDAAYDLGVRIFVVDQKIDPTFYPDAFILEVNNTLGALQQLAKKHREKFDYPVVAITGSSGKTTVKEWLSHIMSSHFSIIRSPKSYNSQLGVALSLLEINTNHTKNYH